MSIIIKKSLQHKQHNLNTDLQAVAIQGICKKEFTVCSVYLAPDEDFTLTELQDLVNQLPSPFLLLGDVNSQHSLGRIFIESFIDTNNLSLFNDGSHTYYNVAHNSSSATDLSICSPDILIDYI